LLALLPAALLFLAALGIFLLQRLRPSVGWSWLIALVSTLITAVGVILLRWRLPQQVAIENWLPFSQFTDSPILGLDGNAWPYLFALSVVALAIILTASARLQYDISPYAWAGVLSLCAVGSLAVLAANLLTLILAWSLLDLIELVILQANSTHRSLGLQTVFAFAFRVTGTGLVMTAILFNAGQQAPPTFSSLNASSALLLLLAVGLRLGVLPLHLPAVQGIILRRGLGTMLRMSAAASSLVVLGRLPAQSIPPALAGPLQLLTALATLYAGIRWTTARDEIEGRPYWLIAFSGLAVSSVFRGNPQSSLVWGMALILPGSLIFLYSARRRQILWLPALALLGYSGLPFTPVSGGWSGLLAPPFRFSHLLLIGAHACLLAGYARLILKPGDDLARMERWVQVAYPAGLLITVLALVFVGTLGLPVSPGMSFGWVGLLSSAVACLGWLGALLWRQRVEVGTPLGQWYAETARRLGMALEAFFNLKWFYQFLWWLYHRLMTFVDLLTQILEGAGGVLWTLVLLALLISLLRTELTP
jgi:hypothetical protein